MPGTNKGRAKRMISLLAQRAVWALRANFQRVEATRPELINKEFSNILVRFFSWARVEK
jgi:hypothetical protein